MNNLIRMMTAHATRTRKVGSITVTGGGNYSFTPTISFSGGGGTGAAATANMLTNNVFGGVTSIDGSQTNGGYSLGSAAPSVSFSNGTAAATANFGSGFLLWLDAATDARSTIQSGTITFSGGGGSGAQVNYSGGAARLLFTPNPCNVTSGGSGYTVAPTVVWTLPGGGTLVTSPSTTVNISGGQVTSVTINSGGEMIVDHYADLSYGLPTPSFSGGNGSGATLGFQTWASTTPLDYWVYGSGLGGTPSVTPGSGYTSAPTASVPGLVTGSVVPIMAKRVTSFTITNSGSYYTGNVPTVSLSGGTSASAGFPIYHSWSVSGSWYDYLSVNTVTVTNSGTGYSSAPTVNFQAGAATATATANMVSE